MNWKGNVTEIASERMGQTSDLCRCRSRGSNAAIALLNMARLHGHAARDRTRLAVVVEGDEGEVG